MDVYYQWDVQPSGKAHNMNTFGQDTDYRTQNIEALANYENDYSQLNHPSLEVLKVKDCTQAKDDAVTFTVLMTPLT